MRSHRKFGYQSIQDATPTKMQPEGGLARTLTFAMVHGRVPWDPEVDPLREREAVMIKAKEEREKLLALEEAKGEKPVVVIDVKKEKGDTEVDGEVLESVSEPPDDPRAFGGR